MIIQDLSSTGIRDVTLLCTSLNIRSLPSNIDLLRLSLNNETNSTKQPIAICIQEIWKCNNPGNLQLLNYNQPILRQRKNKTGGGIGIYVKNDIVHTVIESPFVEGVIETLAVKITVNRKKIVLLNIYRPPGRDLNCLQLLENWLRTINVKVIVTGDFNINTLRNTPMTRDYKNFLKRMGLKNTVNVITRANSSTCIDHVLLTKEEAENYLTEVTSESIADHYTIHLYIKKVIVEEKNEKVTEFRIENEVNKAKYLQKLGSMNWDTIDTLNVNEGVDYLISKIKKAYEESFPLLRRKFNKHKDPINAWMTKDLLIRRDKMRKLGIKAKNRQGVAKVIYETEKKIYKNEIIKAKSNFIKQELKKSGNDSKKIWDVINNQVIGKSKNENVKNVNINGINTTNEKIIAEGFASHFKSAAENLHNQLNIDPDKHKQYLNDRKPAWEFVEVTENEVLKVINSLAPKTSQGIDGISNKLLKMSKFKLLKPISMLFNKCIQTGIFPAHFKIAKVVPIYKKGDRTDINNYRPISLLPTLSKIWEKLLNTQLQEKLDEYEVIIDDQYGFRKNHSTINAVQKLVMEVNKLKRERKVVCAVFIDVSKAFDSCSHELIINKLFNIGLSNNSLLLMKNYLHERSQIVNIGNDNSNPTTIKHGVGQGTILGPLLFKLYIADMVRCTNLKVIHFADDTTFVCSANTKSELTETVNNELKKINDWFNSNYLTLHPDKSRVMVFGNDNNINIKMNNIEIIKCGKNNVEKTFNMLGIRLDQKLLWDSHINYIKSKISKGIYLLWKFRNSLDNRARLLIYHALIRSHLLYGISLWGGVKTNSMSMLVKCQKKAIRGLFKGLVHTEPILKKFCLLSLQDEYKLEIMKMAWSYVQGKLPNGIKDSLETVDNHRNLRRNRTLIVPRHVVRMGKFQIDIKLPKAINKDFNNLTVLNTKAALTRKVKKELISRYRDVVTCNNVGCMECRV